MTFVLDVHYDSNSDDAGVLEIKELPRTVQLTLKGGRQIQIDIDEWHRFIRMSKE